MFDSSANSSLLNKIPDRISDNIPPKMINEPAHEISNNVTCATSKGSDQPAHTRRLIRAFAGGLNIL